MQVTKTARKPGRALTPEERQTKTQQLLDAALDVFLERGFEAARLDEVAKRAGVAKGTLYLYFASKEALFEDLIRSLIASPIQEVGQRMLAQDIPAEMMLRGLLNWAKKEVLGTRRKDIARLIISEAGRFPELGAFYHREVISRGTAVIRAIVTRGVERGEFTSDALDRFPQLLIAPVLVGIIWNGLFSHVETLDTDGLLDVHADLIIRGLKGGAA
ncbi:TetR/AcrR family transcriptional regulator [Flaviflagellibacter deserti]|uniref:TetR/AcrR family transcriptional regulator n=1 Tax=Flaviflagellibacter deserti TaxID=2267266 RepID=A0ABV9Z2A4_9HYPH